MNRGSNPCARAIFCTTGFRSYLRYSRGGTEKIVDDKRCAEERMMVFSGNANPELAKKVADYLNLQLGQSKIRRFSDGEIRVEIGENVRGREVFIVQPTCAPTNDNLMELLIMVDALRRSSAKKITAVIPYFGYARQDRRPRSERVPITARLVADMIGHSGIAHVLTIDLHADQIQGFFRIPVDNIYASKLLMGDVQRHEYPNLIVVSPDVGGVVRARAMAKLLGDTELAIIDKRRPTANVAQVMNIIGDVEGRSCILVDDLVDTAGTLCKAASALKEHGAARVNAYCTHAVLSGLAVENITRSELDEVVVSDTIPLQQPAEACSKIRQVSVAELLGETMLRMSTGESVSSLYAV